MKIIIIQIDNIWADTDAMDGWADGVAVVPAVASLKATKWWHQGAKSKVYFIA